eukprot:3349885-Prymnesium_polylepis.1
MRFLELVPAFETILSTSQTAMTTINRINKEKADIFAERDLDSDDDGEGPAFKHTAGFDRKSSRALPEILGQGIVTGGLAETHFCVLIGRCAPAAAQNKRETGPGGRCRSLRGVDLVWPQPRCIVGGLSVHCRCMSKFCFGNYKPFCLPRMSRNPYPMSSKG